MRMFMKTACVAWACLMAAAAHPILADVRLPGLFGDHMVMQRDVPVKVRGTAESGQAVRVKLGERSAAITAAADGTWEVEFPPMPAGGPVELTVAGKNTLTIKDVLSGDIWLCAGHWNMGPTPGEPAPADKTSDLATLRSERKIAVDVVSA